MMTSFSWPPPEEITMIFNTSELLIQQISVTAY